jgi:PAS domain S-box-containing protein
MKLQPLAERWLRDANTMLGQVRSLFLGFLLAWPIFGLWGIAADASGRTIVLTLVAALVLVIWSYLGYRRRRFPAWSWILEGVCVAQVAGASRFGSTVGMCFTWIVFRALYGPLGEKALGAVVVTGVMVWGVVVYDLSPGATVSLLCTALLALAVNHVLATGCSAGDRSAARRSAMWSAGAGLAAAGTRAEAMDVTLGAALSLDREVSAALLFTVAGSDLHVVAAAGNAGPEAAGWITDLGELPARAQAALQPGGYELIDDGLAQAVTEALRLPPHPVVALAPLAVHDHAFGMLVLAFERHPTDDLATATTALAGEAALILDQLLTRSRLSVVVEHTPDALIYAGETGIMRFVNPAAIAMLDCPEEDLIGHSLWLLLHPDDGAVLLESAMVEAKDSRLCRIRGREAADWTEVEATIAYVSEYDGSRSIVFGARDVSERQRLELELRHAQKLESVGRLAAGIAHEINTPIQFVGDNVRFLETSFADLRRLHEAYADLAGLARAHEDLVPALGTVDEIAEEIDIDFVLDEVPTAVSQTLEGISRVANIVRAMKAFGHPGNDEKAFADLNEAIGHTLIVANNEIKYVADVEKDLGDLPMVECHLGDFNQVVLNLVVNAAHAIGSADRGRGTIKVATRTEGAFAVIEVSDTGTGVPPEIADKIFEPFFTTKEVGTGTGQGLALVRTLVTDRHGGTIDFTSESGVGTTFTVRLPLSSPDAVPAGHLTEATS